MTYYSFSVHDFLHTARYGGWIKLHRKPSKDDVEFLRKFSCLSYYDSVIGYGRGEEGSWWLAWRSGSKPITERM